ncbi:MULTISPECIES: hypothetical protein [unclassified Bradyrhizobium]|uniref:hypothetical protein n=1 Tax=unclassified Bradyrhizobium TaxID=2631580 RepID=UPI001BA6AED0|nr:MULTISPECIES: hypothetical protein [unclassified Bradyrhizobium]MBR1230118.1 hypothetical protein [Bradyrhizobium sp. AUGA SZCCT0176]MBR1301956.1 hypothetical protein [Bradyrhizobium sp. AUGA SZCCT0042]
MKKKLIIAMAIGAVISSVLLAIPSTSGWSGLGLAGLTAAIVFWGIVGESAWGVAVAWVVNAVVYGAGAFFVLKSFNRAAAT